MTPDYSLPPNRSDDVERVKPAYIAGNFEVCLPVMFNFSYKVGLNILRSVNGAVEVAQGTIIRAYDAATQFDRTRKLKPWLATISANNARTYLRMKKQKKNRDPVRFNERGEDIWETISDVTQGRSQLENITQTERTEEIEAVIREVGEESPELYQRFFLLTQGLTHEEVAATLGMSVGTVKSGVHSFRDKVQKVLLRRFPEYGSWRDRAA